jgi:signal transduction histidine kinase/methylmalonyl-CoA mutase cobalamin-binding subunit
METNGEEEKRLRSTALQTANSIRLARQRAQQELVQAKEALERKTGELAQANQSKDLFLAALSHELRTPLTPVLAILSSLRQNTAIPQDVAEDLETVRRNVELEARLIDDLLDLTRITRGKLELHCEPVSLNRMIEDAINACLPDLKAKHLSLVRQFDANDQTIIADSGRVLQILWNLLKNSVKFTPAEGTITIRSRLVTEAGMEYVAVDVQDTGIGINPAKLQRVFEAFEQGDRKITRQFGGIGLGLAISKAIAESHRGTLTAHSQGMGRGATFTLALPFEGCGESERFEKALFGDGSTPTFAPIGASIEQRPLRILLVEDHADTAAVLSRLLRRMGHDVINAANVDTALRLAEKEIRTAGIDLVISDLGLPDGSGLDLMRQLSTKYGLRGIALSGFGMDSDLEQSTAAGFTRHLIKPIDINLVRSTIADVMRSV